MTVSEILDAAADLIEPEGAWTQGTSARNSRGLVTGSCEDDAVCWCTLGAIARSAGDWLVDEALDARHALRNVLRRSVVEWNDAPERTQAEVVAKLREAAERARAVSQ